MISDLEPEIRRIVAGLLDKMKGKTRIDVVDELAYPLPVAVICKILGVPLEAEPRFHAWIQMALVTLDLGRPTQRRGADQLSRRQAVAAPARAARLRW